MLNKETLKTLNDAEILEQAMNELRVETVVDLFKRISLVQNQMEDQNRVAKMVHSYGGRVELESAPGTWIAIQNPLFLVGENYRPAETPASKHHIERDEFTLRGQMKAASDAGSPFNF